MKLYKVHITETLNRDIEVLANDAQEAQRFIEDEYQNESIVLDDGDYIGTDIIADEQPLDGQTINNTMSTSAVYEKEVNNDKA